VCVCVCVCVCARARSLLMAREPLRVIVMGPPKCGKTLQCNLLASRCRLRHVTLDRLVRWHLTQGTREGKEVKKLLRSMNTRATSARAAAECLLLALQPPVPATAAAWTPAAGNAAHARSSSDGQPAGGVAGVEAHGGSAEHAAGMGHAGGGDEGRGDAGTYGECGGDGGRRLGGRAPGEHAAKDCARGKAEDKWARKAQEIVLAMLKTRLAPRRRAGDKGWVLEGLPLTPSMARGFWDLGDHCWPHVVIALEPSPEPSQAPPCATERPHGAAVSTASKSASGASAAGVRDRGDGRDTLNSGPHGRGDFGDAGYGDADADEYVEMGFHGLRTFLAENAAVDEEAAAGSHAGVSGEDVSANAGPGRDREACTEGERVRTEGAGVCDRDEVALHYYRRHVWDILDFFHGHKVVCAMISRLDAEADDCPRTAAGAALDDICEDAVASGGREGRARGEVEAAVVEGKGVESGGKRKAGAVGDAVAGPGGGNPADGEGWLRVGEDGGEGAYAAARVHTAGDAAAVASASQGSDADMSDREVQGEQAAAAGARAGDARETLTRSQGMVRDSDADARGWGGGARGARSVSRPSFMSPPDLHRAITRVVGSYMWGGTGVREPSLQDLALTDPDEFEKLHRLLEMGAEECAAWLAAGDMPFTTTTKEARVAQILGLPLSSIARLETAPLGGHTPKDRVTVDTMQEYAELVCHRRLVEDVAHQMAQVLSLSLSLAPSLSFSLHTHTHAHIDRYVYIHTQAHQMAQVLSPGCL